MLFYPDPSPSPSISQVFFFDFFASLEKRGVKEASRNKSTSASFDAPLRDHHGRRSGKYTSVREGAAGEISDGAAGSGNNSGANIIVAVGGGGGGAGVDAALEPYTGPAPKLPHISDAALVGAYGGGDDGTDSVRLLAEERAARTRAEAMYVSLYNFMEEHHGHLKSLNTQKKRHSTSLELLEKKEKEKKKRRERVKVKFRAVSKFLGTRALLQRKNKSSPAILAVANEKKQPSSPSPLLTRNKSSLSSLFSPASNAVQPAPVGDTSLEEGKGAGNIGDDGGGAAPSLAPPKKATTSGAGGRLSI
jgi:hypothetical protein